MNSDLRAKTSVIFDYTYSNYTFFLVEECRALQSPQKYAVGNAVTDTDYEEWKRRIIEAATAAINKDGQEQTKSAKKKKKWTKESRQANRQTNGRIEGGTDGESK